MADETPDVFEELLKQAKSGAADVTEGLGGNESKAVGEEVEGRRFVVEQEDVGESVMGDVLTALGGIATSAATSRTKAVGSLL